MRTFKELAKIGIHDIHDYRGLRDIRHYFDKWEDLLRVEFGFTRNMASLLKNLPDSVHNSNGVSLLISEMVPKLSHGHIAKAIAFFRTTYMIRPELSMNEFSLRGEDIKISFGPDISGCLNVAYNHKSEVSNGHIAPLPDVVRLINFNRVLDNHLEENPYLDAETAQKIPKLVDVSLTGRGMGHTDEHLQLGLVLPSLAALPLETVRKLRRDFQPEFVQFQNALQQFAEEIGAIDGETKLIHLLRETESQVFELKRRLEEARTKQRSLAALGVATGMVFCLGVPVEALKSFEGALQAVFTATFGQGLWEWLKEPKAKLESSPYYFPFRLLREGKKRTRRVLRG
ncbi:hypothetical protein [Nannocystis pusilla]|uniref:hypothetical protein n=1 Tax=Nannocystis pusilla TaxID=889268 RepID=UPI003DA580B1